MSPPPRPPHLQQHPPQIRHSTPIQHPSAAPEKSFASSDFQLQHTEYSSSLSQTRVPGAAGQFAADFAAQSRHGVEQSFSNSSLFPAAASGVDSTTPVHVEQAAYQQDIPSSPYFTPQYQQRHFSSSQYVSQSSDQFVNKHGGHNIYVPGPTKNRQIFISSPIAPTPTNRADVDNYVPSKQSENQHTDKPFPAGHPPANTSFSQSDSQMATGENRFVHSQNVFLPGGHRQLLEIEGGEVDTATDRGPRTNRSVSFINQMNQLGTPPRFAPENKQPYATGHSTQDPVCSQPTDTSIKSSQYGTRSLPKTRFISNVSTQLLRGGQNAPNNEPELDMGSLSLRGRGAVTATTTTTTIQERETILSSVVQTRTISRHKPPQYHPPQNHPPQYHPPQDHPPQYHPLQDHPPQYHPPPEPNLKPVQPEQEEIKVIHFGVV